MPTINLSRGRMALVDDERFEELNQFKWHFVATSRTDPDYGFAGRWVSDSSGKRILLLMHRLLAGAQPHQEVDHKDRNPLNNQIDNLRIATRSENAHNTGPRKGLYKGAKFHKVKQKWEATIRVDERNQYLGNFATAEEAAIAYDVAAIQVFGDSAYLNLIAVRA